MNGMTLVARTIGQRGARKKAGPDGGGKKGTKQAHGK